MSSAMQLVAVPFQLVAGLLRTIQHTPLHILCLAFIALALLGLLAIYVTLHLVAPKPRAVLPSEKTYLTVLADGSVSRPLPLPCWYDRWAAERALAERRAASPATPVSPHAHAFPPDPTVLPVTAIGDIEPAEVRVSVVFPAYNEEARMAPALEEAVAYLDAEFGRPPASPPTTASSAAAATTTPTSPGSARPRHHAARHAKREPKPDDGGGAKPGYEILIVNDGSRDATVAVALEFARKHGLAHVLRVVTLEKNRGKGGGVTHGFRHVRGEYALFADADGASKFSDLGRLIEGCDEVADAAGRGVAVGSRAHLVGSEAVVKRSALRNFLMRSFHLILTILTPPATSRIRDTQCGFKLFSRAALPHIVPYMHAEGWIFDIEMLMLAESAPPAPILGSDGSVIGDSPGIKVAEVPVGWHEVEGSKMSLIKDSAVMAIGLAILRASWMLGVYRRRLA